MAQPVMVIFGASGGIGSALARTLTAAGAVVALASRKLEVIEPLAESLGGRAWRADGTQSADVNRVLAAAQGELGRVDGVANCIGSLLLKPAHLTTEEEWADVLRVNLTSAFLIVRAAAKSMMSTGGGSIALVSSVAAQLGLANHEAIAAAKAGIIGLVRAAGASYAAKNIRINAVAPGLTRTPLTDRITSHEASLKATLAMHPLGRIGTPEDVATALAFLLAPSQGWITGQVLGVDGGLGCLRPRG